jgi:hypothetical protein
MNVKRNRKSIEPNIADLANDYKPYKIFMKEMRSEK